MQSSRASQTTVPARLKAHGASTRQSGRERCFAKRDARRLQHLPSTGYRQSKQSMPRVVIA